MVKKPKAYVDENGVWYIKKCRYGCDLAENCDDCMIETSEVNGVVRSSVLVCSRDDKMCDRDSKEGRNYEWMLSSVDDEGEELQF